MSRLRFHDCLGRGGYGAVYRATWFTSRGMQLEVAVKVLNASVARGSDAQRRLRDEARLLGALTHPGIVRVYDLVEVRGAVGMIAEFVEGQDLDRCVLDGLPPRALVEVVSRVSSALAAAWGDLSPVSGKPLRLVHRDIKPENLRVTPNGLVKILDFGVARAAELRRESETASNMVLGSYRYMAPERFDAGLEPHPSLDVFALGAILYEGLAYRRLFEHLSVREMLVLSLPGTDRYEGYVEDRIDELPDTTEPSLIALIRRLVSRDPAARPMPGRLAAICDELAESIDGPGLAEWCGSRGWEYLSAGDGDLTGSELVLSDGVSIGIEIAVPIPEGSAPRSGGHTIPRPTPAPPVRRGPTPKPAPPTRRAEPEPVSDAESKTVEDVDLPTEGIEPLEPTERETFEDDPDAMATQALTLEALQAITRAAQAQADTVDLGPLPVLELEDDPPSEELTSEGPPIEPDFPTQPDALDAPPEPVTSTRPKLYVAEPVDDEHEDEETVEVSAVQLVPSPSSADRAARQAVVANLAVLVLVGLIGVFILMAWVVLA